MINLPSECCKFRPTARTRQPISPQINQLPRKNNQAGILFRASRTSSTVFREGPFQNEPASLIGSNESAIGEVPKDVVVEICELSTRCSLIYRSLSYLIHSLFILHNHGHFVVTHFCLLVSTFYKGWDVSTPFYFLITISNHPLVTLF